MTRFGSHLFLTVLAVIFAVSTLSQPLAAQSGRIGIFDGKSDVGTVVHPGTAAYDEASHAYTLRAAGENMWMKKDGFYFVWKKVSGDVALSATIQFPHPGKNPHRKAALLFRQGLEPDAVYADAALHGSGLTALQYRAAKGDVTGDIELNFSGIDAAPAAFRIEKHGHQVSMYVSQHGEPMHPSGTSMRVPIDGEFYVGLGVCSHDNDVVEEAIFTKVMIEPLAGGATAKPEVYSTLQTISIDPSARRATMIYTTQGQFDAPNWTRDGKSLIFVQQGKMMTVPSAGLQPTSAAVINTGTADHCNGSHGLSPDGKLLAITCTPAGSPGAQVYIVPTAGGEPRLLTATPSSYFHSWSPDGKTIAFARPHTGGGDIFSISVEGGQEKRLTTTASISDDPDYSPDGKYIYFNSDRAGGTMQIWRMLADGTKPEQVTSDPMNNWTPHVSPDGKLMVFISYDHSVAGHPANKEISLRVMSLDDKKIRTLVDLTGGSGTMNVPSWSPDSHNLAFVSYDLLPASQQ